MWAQFLDELEQETPEEAIPKTTKPGTTIFESRDTPTSIQDLWRSFSAVSYALSQKGLRAILECTSTLARRSCGMTLSNHGIDLLDGYHLVSSYRPAPWAVTLVVRQITKFSWCFLWHAICTSRLKPTTLMIHCSSWFRGLTVDFGKLGRRCSTSHGWLAYAQPSWWLIHTELVRPRQ